MLASEPLNDDQNWMIALASQLQPLINLLRDHQNNNYFIQIDETRAKVLKEPGRSAASNKYRWVTLGGPPKQQSVLFEYDPSRSQAVSLRLLGGFKGWPK